MSTDPNGGAAFPRPATISPTGVYVSECEQGMTLRDWFAGQVIVGILPHCGTGSAKAQAGYIAEAAYAVADAMLEERRK